MKTKNSLVVVLTISIFVVFSTLLASCTQATATPIIAPLTQVSSATQLSTNIPTPTPLPTSTAVIYPTVTPMPTAVPYPIASVVKADAIAFISENSLWVANIDGSGERKLVDIAYNKKDGDWGITYYYLQWSPDGKWIGYIASHELWITSRDGSEKRKLLSLPETREFFNYVWSPDSSKIAYLNTVSDKEKPIKTPTPGPESGMAPYLVGMIDIATGNMSELSSFEANAGIPVLKWSPDGRNLLFIKDYSFVLFDVATSKIVKTIKRGCGLERGLSWAPNGKWFSYTDNGVGGFNPTWICVNSATGGSIQTIRVDSTSLSPIWDKSGNYLYFLAAKIDLNRQPDPLIDERLMRYDARTQKTESLLSLKEQQQLNSYSYIRSLSISPDGHTLELHSTTSQTKCDFIFIDIQSLTITKFTLELEGRIKEQLPPPEWSSDSQRIIFFVQNLHRMGYGLDFGHDGSFYTLNIKTGKTTIFSGVHRVENARVSPITPSP